MLHNIALMPNLAVLIDAENICATCIPAMMERITGSYGNAAVRRVYGDWTTLQLIPWKKALEASALRPSQQFRHVKGKNSCDGALIMDAMELLLTRAVEGFCIVSSDSDFTGLAVRIREKGMRVYGFGMRHTMRAFVVACDEFVFLDEEVSRCADWRGLDKAVAGSGGQGALRSDIKGEPRP